MKICIIGGGFSGASLALRLLPQTRPGQITIVEPRNELGLGPAYGTTYPNHLLNVPADRMGIFAEAPDDFFTWLTAVRHQNVAPASFLPRVVYGTYLKETLAPIVSAVRHVRSRAIDIDHVEGANFAVTFDDGSHDHFDAVVLALGNQLPAVPSGLREISEQPGFITNPWIPDALAALVKLDSIVIIGTGLTSVDTILELYERGFGGRCTMISRRGLLPRSHPALRFAAIPPVLSLPISLRTMIRTLREESRKAPWQAVVDSIRPLSAELWQGLSKREKHSFLLRVRPYWDIHRHRIPEESARTLNEMQRDGRLTVVGGHLTDGSYAGGQFSLSIRNKRGISGVVADAIVNCAGPGPAVQDRNCTLIQTLCEKGLATADDCRMGLRIDAKLRVVHSGGNPVTGLFAMGSLLQGTLWECISVPELRQCARLIAHELVAHTKSKKGSLAETA
jgi:uncharacterized NAD(P)/FAD-binding protein YdhS